MRAEPGLVSIAVARPDRRVLQLADVWSHWNPSCVGGNIELLIGVREENSELLYLSPEAECPHTLIAGSTGSGKSVLMQNLILGIAVTNRPYEARITVIDPKLGVDYFAFEGLPHLTAVRGLAGPSHRSSKRIGDRNGPTLRHLAGESRLVGVQPERTSGTTSFQLFG